ncbi:expressed unknown protein [Seminavis robusta]|uniref:Uncharacterized protein n=1 Tax=Seminavis robusta TaxID=568900 RepID=A0A9N8EHT5_9STRA|nr:expressed unknown protein [Seminavis robusta]|eukprot:Sro974_g226700.1 n/a (580) ;mRNA; f:21176-23062
MRPTSSPSTPSNININTNMTVSPSSPSGTIISPSNSTSTGTGSGTSSTGMKVFRLVRNFVVSVAIWESITFDTKPFKDQWAELYTNTSTITTSTSTLNTNQISLKDLLPTVLVKKEVEEFSVTHLDSINTLTPSHPVHCYHHALCCGKWDVNADEWWTHHPQWFKTKQDNLQLAKIGFCFAPTQNQDHLAFLQELHQLQWGIDIQSQQSTTSLQQLASVIPESYNFTDVNCSNPVTAVPISSGYGASLSHIYKSFWYAFTSQQPFLLIKRGPWMYATKDVNHTWAYCPTRDFGCLYLPLSPCSRERPQDMHKPHMSRRPNQKDPLQAMQWLWLRDYMTRPNQKFQHELAKLQEPYIPLLQNSHCIALHVRRGDSGVPRQPFRRYAAIQEYLDILPPKAITRQNKKKPTIFLLTDDATTIDELYQYHINVTTHPQFHWIYTQKLRNRATELGFEMHIPVSSDGPQELLWITAELNLAAQYCTALLHGTSGYADQLYDRMQFYAGEKNNNSNKNNQNNNQNNNQLQRYYLDTTVRKHQIQQYRGKIKERENVLLQSMADFYANRTTTRSTTGHNNGTAGAR